METKHLRTATLGAVLLFALGNSPFPGGCNSDVSRAHRASERHCERLVDGQLPEGCTGVPEIDGPPGSLACSLDRPVDCGNGYCCGGKHATCCAEGHWCGTDEDACTAIASSHPDSDDEESVSVGSSSSAPIKCGAQTTCPLGGTLQFCTAANDVSCLAWYQLGGSRLECGTCDDVANLQACSERASSTCGF